MANLYARLTKAGFPQAYIRDRILPDWWSDTLAQELENRRLAEMTISRTLKIPLASLVDDSTPLTFENEPGVRFKRWHDVAEARLLPAVIVARRVCELILACVDVPPLTLRHCSASSLREQILRTDPYLTLTPLVQHCWNLGIPVVHLEHLPAGARRLDGLALLVANRPCIVLASSRQSPAWLVWHLAHEVGHVALGHLANGDAIDIEIDFADDQQEEKEANRFATNLIYGDVQGFRSDVTLKPASLVREAQEIGPVHRIHPACVVTSYGFDMKAWDVANAALKMMQLAQGGAVAIRKALDERMDLDRLTPTDRHFLTGVTGLAD